MRATGRLCTTSMRIGHTRWRGTRMARILNADDCPLTTLFLHPIMQRHACYGGAAFGLKRHSDVGLITATEIDRRKVHIHGSHADTGTFEMIQHALPDSFVTRISPVARPKEDKRHEEKRDSHLLIITVL